MTIDSQSSGSNTKGSINNYKTLSCFTKNKSKAKHQKSPWHRLSIPKLYNRKLSMPKRWWPRKDNFKLRLLIKTNKSRRWIWEYKKWQVSTREKFLSWRRKFNFKRMIIRNGLNNSKDKLNHGMRREQIWRTRFTNWSWLFKTKKPKTKLNNKTTWISFHKRIWKFHHCKENSTSQKQRAPSCNQRCKSRFKTSKRHTLTLRPWWTSRRKDGLKHHPNKSAWWNNNSRRKEVKCKLKLMIWREKTSFSTTITRKERSEKLNLRWRSETCLTA